MPISDTILTIAEALRKGDSELRTRIWDEYGPKQAHLGGLESRRITRSDAQAERRIHVDPAPHVSTEIPPSDPASFPAPAYYNYSPARDWHPPYLLLQMRFPLPSDLNGSAPFYYQYHNGEEILIADGPSSTMIHFFGQRSLTEAPTHLTFELSPFDVARINPEVPHRVTTTGEGSTWVVLRSATNTNPSLIVPKLENTVVSVSTRGGAKHAPGIVFASQLEGASAVESTYYMLSWGIATGIETERRKAGLQPSDLATFSGSSDSYITKLENGEINPTLETLRKIFRVLELDPERFIAKDHWHSLPAELGQPDGVSYEALAEQLCGQWQAAGTWTKPFDAEALRRRVRLQNDFRLHTHALELQEPADVTIPGSPKGFASIIVTKGNVAIADVVEASERWGGSIDDKVPEGGVLHIRGISKELRLLLTADSPGGQAVIVYYRRETPF